ncbi:B3 domain-containing protein REM5 [Prunus yedoensis var. nudiflora]|uniref:B3 domain-containing protein REM5 n=1 Tax=Prunus yedoensis var. nudiflora TaxID=2094558 RepID=A0A314YUV6_PRUYE|nr:B3 domain-containing protein REM5 [Prunus yedoensis var. nudiflora]
MDEKLKCPLERPSFRMLLVGDDFSQHLPIPPAFIKNFNGRRLGKCTLRGPSGKCWAVELEQRRDGLFFHKDWPGFVKDHFIELEDFLIFYYDGGSEFNVTIYDKTCCEKDVKAAGKRPASDHLAETSTGGPILFKSENTFFIQTLKSYNLYAMLMPKDIAIAEGLMSSEGILIKETIMLQDQTGRSCLTNLYLTPDGRLMMTEGWTTCRKANQISLGDDIVFEFVKKGAILVHILRGKGNNSSSMVLSGSQPRKSKT